MKNLLLFAVLVTLPLLLGSVCHAELRTWTSIVGTKVEAELVSLTGNQVTLKTKAGKTLKLPLNKLSKADQEFLTAKSSPKEPTKEETPVNPNLKYEVKDSAVTITGCDKKASGALTIPATIEGKAVTSIGEAVFSDCRDLTSITIPDSVTSIEGYAFRRCSGLSSITIGNSVTSIGEAAFIGCISLMSITIPDSVTSIGKRAFKFSALTSITIPDSVTSIGEEAFGVTRLKTITIPDSVTSIGEMAFYECKSLTTVTFLGDAPKAGRGVFNKANPTIYRKPEAKGWGDTFAGKPVKLISEKPNNP
jgi:hypothetical protein